MEKTFVMLKPDCVARRLIGEVLSRFEKKGLKIVALKFLHMDKSKAEKLYEVHKARDFYPALVQFATSAPVVVMVLEGYNAVKVVRTMLGATFSFEAQPGTIRGDYGLSKGHNVIHASDSPERALFEMKIFFADSELVEYKQPDTDIIYEKNEIV